MNNQSPTSPKLLSNYSKTNPYLSKIIKRNLLSKDLSSKKTYHISLYIDDSIQFKPGDSIGIYPENHLDEIEELLSIIPLDKNIDQKTKELLKNKNLQLVTQKFIQLLLPLLKEEDQIILQQKILEENFLKSHNIISLIKNYQPVKPFDKERFEQILPPMLPRFYSIASSLSKEQNELHLLIGTFNYEFHGKITSGLGSSFLCQHALVNETPIPFFIHPSRNFSLPSPTTPIIMIGPGTGVAPFRAFIQERRSQDASKNWLFFGERTRFGDFYYEEEFNKYKEEGFLRLSVAFSRDQEHKIYVQNKIYEEKDEFYRWIQDGAVIYICGDAKKMAKDVQDMICKILSEKEFLTIDLAINRFKELKKNQKIIFEVY